MTDGDLVLLPRPRRLTITAAEPAGGQVRYATDPGLPGQGYRIDADADGVVITHADGAGRRYAGELLAQVRSHCDGSVPSMRVEDWPDLATRGFLLDVSRNRVPTRPTLARFVEVLALARYNQLQLYVEHAYAYRGHDVVWRDASPLTGDDLAWLDGHCADAGIELVANQNTFGHMERWLRHAGYVDRAECPDGFEPVPGVRLPPGVLAPTDDNAEFALALVREQAANLSSRGVNIGCDETFELGLGESAVAVAQRGKGRVYLEHVQRLAGPLLAEGGSVQLWGDIIGHHPELIAELPAGDLTALVWHYEAPGATAPRLSRGMQAVLDALGVDLAGAGFSAMVDPFAAAGVPFFVCPGTSTWNSLVGRLDNARANLLDAARVGASSGAAGCLVTDWGDNGHLQPPVISFAPAVYGGAVAWCADANADLDVPAALDRFVFADSTGVLGSVVDRLGRLWRLPGQDAVNGSPLQAGLCPRQPLLVGGQASVEGLEEVVDQIDDAMWNLTAARPACADAGIVVEELTVAARLARHGAWRLLAASGGAAPDPADLAADLSESRERFAAVWSARSRPGGLSDSLAHLDATPATYAT